MEHPYHQRLVLENFTAFSHAEFEFGPGVNVIVGENGTGKTHVLKALYAASRSFPNVMIEDVGEYLKRVFLAEQESHLIRLGPKKEATGTLSGAYAGKAWKVKINQEWRNDPFSTTKSILWEGSAFSPLQYPHQDSIKDLDYEPVFLPALDMLGHTKAFLSTYERYRIDFDETHRNIVSQLLSPTARVLDAFQLGLLSSIEPILQGKLILEGERFYLRTAFGQIPAPLLGEGLRKIATLIRLIQVGLLRPGSALFWDEPEGGMNPKLIKAIVECVYSLSSVGVQIFIATHNYLLIRELEVQTQKSNRVKFFVLEPTPDGSIARSASSYLDFRPNAIEDAMVDLYDRSLDKAIGR